jgi:hypothetical protein
LGWFSKSRRTAIANPVSGRLQVVACSPFPDSAGEVILRPKCDIDGVITAERLVPTAVRYSGYDVPKAKWPRSGAVLPVTVDVADPTRFRIEWQQVPTGREAAEALAEHLRAGRPGEPPEDKSGGHAFPRVWRELAPAAASPTLVNGLTPQQTELALSGRSADVGLVPAIATVLAAREVAPSSAPGGTWEITVRVVDPTGGPDWRAVTRMSFSSRQRREKRTAAGLELPVLVDPDNRNRIIVDVARLS